MKTTCPKCGFPFDTIKAREHEARELKARLFIFDYCEGLAMEYLDCFRVKPDSPISHKKAMRVIDELAKIWVSEYFSYRGRDWRTTREKIKDAMTVCCNRQIIGLMNHNYVKAILHKDAVQAEIKEERDKHEKAMNRPRLPSPPAGEGGPLGRVGAHPAETNDPVAVKKIIEAGKLKLGIKTKGGA